VVFLFSALTLLIFFNVISRSVFQQSFRQILEFSPAVVLWLALLGSSLAIKDNRHIKIEVLLRFVTPGFRLRANKITSAFGMMVMGVLFYASLEFVVNEIAIFGCKGWVTVIFPVFFIVAVFRFFLNLLDATSPGVARGAGENLS
jgi:TRAP-type C4-dicarboxylate transport system permease small subunit